MRTLKQHRFRKYLRRAIENEQAELEKEGQRKRLTAAEYFALRSQVRAEVEVYLLENGPDAVTGAMLEQFTGLSTKKCLRDMVTAIVDEPPSPEALDAARQRIEARLEGGWTQRQIEAKRNGTAHIARYIPAAPSPAYIAKAGVQQLDKLDIFVELTNLFRDANMLRDSAVKPQPDGSEKVTNARVFDRSISRRVEILATSIATRKELWDLQRMEMFYATIIETIAGEAPEVAQKIQKKLAEVNMHIGAA
jgi:hypothetical protein